MDSRWAVSSYVVFQRAQRGAMSQQIQDQPASPGSGFAGTLVASLSSALLTAVTGIAVAYGSLILLFGMLAAADTGSGREEVIGVLLLYLLGLALLGALHAWLARVLRVRRPIMLTLATMVWGALRGWSFFPLQRISLSPWSMPYSPVLWRVSPYCWCCCGRPVPPLRGAPCPRQSSREQPDYRT